MHLDLGQALGEIILVLLLWFFCTQGLCVCAKHFCVFTRSSENLGENL